MLPNVPPSELTRDEAVLHTLTGGPMSTAGLVERLQIPERSVRRRLQRLIRDGYVFSPRRGTYRITAAGLRVIESATGPATTRKENRLRPLWAGTPADLAAWARGDRSSTS